MIPTGRATFIITSNFAAEELILPDDVLTKSADESARASAVGEAYARADNARQTWPRDKGGRRNPFMRAEARGRIDGFIHFLPYAEDERSLVVTKHLERAVANIERNFKGNLTLAWTPTVVQHFAQRYSSLEGLRPVINALGDLTKLLRNARNDGVFRTDLRGSAALLDTLGGVGGGGRGGDDVAHNLVVRGLGVLDLDGLVVPQAVERVADRSARRGVDGGRSGGNKTRSVDVDTVGETVGLARPLGGGGSSGGGGSYGQTGGEGSRGRELAPVAVQQPASSQQMQVQAELEAQLEAAHAKIEALEKELQTYRWYVLGLAAAALVLTLGLLTLGAFVLEAFVVAAVKFVAVAVVLGLGAVAALWSRLPPWLRDLLKRIVSQPWFPWLAGFFALLALLAVWRGRRAKRAASAKLARLAAAEKTARTAKAEVGELAAKLAETEKALKESEEAKQKLKAAIAAESERAGRAEAIAMVVVQLRRESSSSAADVPAGLAAGGASS